MIDEIKIRLDELKTIDYKNFSNKLIKTKLTILGIKTPILRDMAKDIAKNNYKDFLENNDYSSYEITLLEAFVIGYAKMDLDERFKYLDKFIPLIDNWAIHDGLVSTLKFSNKNKEEVFNYLLKYINSNKEFEQRFVSIMLMSYYLCDEYIEKAFEIIRKIQAKEYYSKMGIAWFLATASIKYKDRVYDYLKNINDKEIILMTIRKIRDSYRIDNSFKNKVLELK